MKKLYYLTGCLILTGALFAGVSTSAVNAVGDGCGQGLPNTVFLGDFGVGPQDLDGMTDPEFIAQITPSGGGTIGDPGNLLLRQIAIT